MAKIKKVKVREVKVREMECPFCGEVWQPRVRKPKQCPYCHRYFNPSDKPSGKKKSSRRRK
jgi:predicted Zn-ribbon and HTH transcriptional regulator